MTPAEAGSFLLEEPDWTERYRELIAGVDEKLPIELREDDAFEKLFREYRRFHFTWGEHEGKPARFPLESTKATIGLAKLRIFPPRSRTKDVPRDGKLYEPDVGDNHCWLISQERAWRIQTIESRTMILDSFGESWAIDLQRAVWEKYVEKAVEAMEAAWPDLVGRKGPKAD